MRRRPLGTSGVTVSEIGLGTARLASTARRGSDRDAMRLVREAYDLGIAFFDTADSYGQGKSEELLGRALRGVRDDVVVATKGGYRLSAAGGLAARLKPVLRPLVRRVPALGRGVQQVRGSQLQQAFDPAHLRGAIEASLRRLGTDRIDVYLLHSPPASVAERDDVFEALEAARAAGLLRSYGAALADVDDGEQWSRARGIGALEVPVGPTDQRALAGVLPSAAATGVGVIARGVLGPALDPAARSAFGLGGRRPVQTALQFVLRQPAVATVLVGTTDRDHLREDARASECAPLADEELAALTAASRPAT